jgi:hypothetical protein
MEKETVHVVQAYVAGRGKALMSEPPMACKSADEALRRATRLSTLRPGVDPINAALKVGFGPVGHRQSHVPRLSYRRYD